MSGKDNTRQGKHRQADSKRGKNEIIGDFVLENISGVSCISKDALAANPADGSIAFAASSMLVFIDPRYSQQDFLENPSGRGIKAVNFSDDGKYVAYGEAGYNPTVFIHNKIERKHVCKFQVSNNSCVKALEFHPRSIYLVVMCAGDFSIAIFDLMGFKIARVTFVVEPLGMSLPKIGSYLIVCGHRKVSLFSFMDADINASKTNIVFDRRSVLLGHQSDYTFVDVTSGSGLHVKKIYTVTSCGYLCDLNVGDILIDRASKVDTRCFCVKYSFGCVFVGCTKNTVKICSPVNLSIVSTIVENGIFGPTHSRPNIWKFEADAVAIAVNTTTKTITCAFSDHHRHSWHVRLINDSIECEPIIPVDADGKEVKWQPTSYEIQEKVASILNENTDKTSRSGTAGKSGSHTNVSKGATSSRVNPFATFYVNATRFTPDGKKIICGNAEGEIKIFNAITGRLSRVIEAHSAAVTHIELLYDDCFKLMASGGRDRLIFILDAKNNYELIQVLCEHSSAVISISMAHYDGVLTLVSSANDGVILVRRAIKGRQLRFVIVAGLADVVGKPRIYAYASDCIVTGGDSGYLKYFRTDPYISARSNKTAKSMITGKKYVKAVAIDPSGYYLVANSATGTLVFNIETGKHVATTTKIPGVPLITFTPDCRYLVSESNDGCRCFWRIPTKMTEVMRAKLGGDAHFTTPIICEKIPPGVGELQKSPTGYVSALEVQTEDSSYSYRRRDDTTLTSDVFPPYRVDNEVKTFASEQSTSVECASYSTCSTCSQSYTDILNFSKDKDSPDGEKENAEFVPLGISQEARRLLKDMKLSSLDTSLDMNTLSGVWSKRSDCPLTAKTTPHSSDYRKTTTADTEDSKTSPASYRGRAEDQSKLDIPLEDELKTGFETDECKWETGPARVSKYRLGSPARRFGDCGSKGAKNRRPSAQTQDSLISEYVSVASPESTFEDIVNLDVKESDIFPSVSNTETNHSNSDGNSDVQDTMPATDLNDSQERRKTIDIDDDSKSGRRTNQLLATAEKHDGGYGDSESNQQDMQSKSSFPCLRERTFVYGASAEQTIAVAEPGLLNVSNLYHEQSSQLQTSTEISPVLKARGEDLVYDKDIKISETAEKLDFIQNAIDQGDSIARHIDRLHDINQNTDSFLDHQVSSHSVATTSNTSDRSSVKNSCNNYSLCSTGEERHRVLRGNSQRHAQLTNSQETVNKCPLDTKGCVKGQDLVKVVLINRPQDFSPQQELLPAQSDFAVRDSLSSIYEDVVNSPEEIIVPIKEDVTAQHRTTEGAEQSYKGDDCHINIAKLELKNTIPKVDDDNLGSVAPKSPEHGSDGIMVRAIEPEVKINTICYKISKGRYHKSKQKDIPPCDKSEKSKSTTRDGLPSPSNIKSALIAKRGRKMRRNPLDLKSYNPQGNNSSEPSAMSGTNGRSLDVEQDISHFNTKRTMRSPSSGSRGYRSKSMHVSRVRLEHEQELGPDLMIESKSRYTSSSRGRSNHLLQSSCSSKSPKEQPIDAQDDSENESKCAKAIDPISLCMSNAEARVTSEEVDAIEEYPLGKCQTPASIVEGPSPNLSKTGINQNSEDSKDSNHLDQDKLVVVDYPLHQDSDSPTQSENIAGLGGVVHLFCNQDDYLKKLREVRRDFEMSIEALRLEAAGQQGNFTKHTEEGVIFEESETDK